MRLLLFYLICWFIESVPHHSLVLYSSSTSLLILISLEILMKMHFCLSKLLLIIVSLLVVRLLVYALYFLKWPLTLSLLKSYLLLVIELLFLCRWTEELELWIGLASSLSQPCWTVTVYLWKYCGPLRVLIRVCWVFGFHFSLWELNL